MKIKITTQIESELKNIFDSTIEFTNLGYQEALERGVREILTELNNINFIDQEISRGQTEIIKISQKQAKLESMREKLKNIRTEIHENRNNGNQPEDIEKFRDKIFEKNLGESKKREGTFQTNKNQWQENHGRKWDWEKIIELYRFKDKSEAKEWFKKKYETPIL